MLVLSRKKMYNDYKVIFESRGLQIVEDLLEKDLELIEKASQTIIKNLNGEREFECLVAVRGEKGEEILPPCGNCRQFLSDYMPDCKVIINTKTNLKKIAVKELLPFAYSVPE